MWHDHAIPKWPKNYSIFTKCTRTDAFYVSLFLGLKFQSYWLCGRWILYLEFSPSNCVKALFAPIPGGKQQFSFTGMLIGWRSNYSLGSWGRYGRRGGQNDHYRLWGFFFWHFCTILYGKLLLSKMSWHKRRYGCALWTWSVKRLNGSGARRR